MSKPLAITPAYNEADVIAHTLRHLQRQGFDCVVIDNHSTDATATIARECGAFVDRWPAEPQAYTCWRDMLKRVAEIAASHDGWVMFNDADEIRYAPQPYQTISEWFGDIYDTAAAFTVRTYWPIDNGWESQPAEVSSEQYFRHYTLEGVDSSLPHVKAWYQPAVKGVVDLHSSGGHHVQFPGMRVSHSSVGVLKHYPIRSQQHGERKVFRERNLRWSSEEKRAQWHVQYNGYAPGDSFLRSVNDMLREED